MGSHNWFGSCGGGGDVVGRFIYFISFVDGELEDEGSGNLDINIGGEINPSTSWDFTVQKNFDKDLTSFRRGEETGLENDWNVFFNVTRSF